MFVPKKTIYGIIDEKTNESIKVIGSESDNSRSTLVRFPLEPLKGSFRYSTIFRSRFPNFSILRRDDSKFGAVQGMR
jgi:hypothetical protein